MLTCTKWTSAVDTQDVIPLIVGYTSGPSPAHITRDVSTRVPLVTGCFESSVAQQILQQAVTQILFAAFSSLS
jgi:hypothetical protein